MYPNYDCKCPYDCRAPHVVPAYIQAYAYINLLIHTYIQADTHTTNTYIHTYMHACIHTYILTYIHTHYIHTYTYIHTYQTIPYHTCQAHTHIHTYIQSHTDIHTAIHTGIHTYIAIPTHTTYIQGMQRQSEAVRDTSIHTSHTNSHAPLAFSYQTGLPFYVFFSLPLATLTHIADMASPVSVCFWDVCMYVYVCM